MIDLDSYRVLLLQWKKKKTPKTKNKQTTTTKEKHPKKPNKTPTKTKTPLLAKIFKVLALRGTLKLRF